LISQKLQKWFSFLGLHEYFLIYPDMFQNLPNNFQAKGGGCPPSPYMPMPPAHEAAHEARALAARLSRRLFSCVLLGTVLTLAAWWGQTCKHSSFYCWYILSGFIYHLSFVAVFWRKFSENYCS